MGLTSIHRDVQRNFRTSRAISQPGSQFAKVTAEDGFETIMQFLHSRISHVSATRQAIANGTSTVSQVRADSVGYKLPRSPPQKAATDGASKGPQRDPATYSLEEAAGLAAGIIPDAHHEADAGAVVVLPGIKRRSAAVQPSDATSQAALAAVATTAAAGAAAVQAAQAGVVAATAVASQAAEALIVAEAALAVAAEAAAAADRNILLLSIATPISAQAQQEMDSRHPDFLLNTLTDDEIISFIVYAVMLLVLCLMVLIVAALRVRDIGVSVQIDVGTGRGDTGVMLRTKRA